MASWGCDDPKGASGGQGEGAQASNGEADEAPGATSGAPDVAPPAEVASTGGGAGAEGAPAVDPDAPLVAVDLGIERSTLTLKIGDDAPTTHELTRGGQEIWTWTADASRNLLFYNANTKEPGAFASAVINLNQPGAQLDLGKIGTGAPAAIHIVFNEKDADFAGARVSIHAEEGTIKAERDPVSGAMKGTFEGRFKKELSYKPLVTGPEHEPVMVKMSGSFAVQPPPREEVLEPPVGRTEVIKPNMMTP
jgi:hypothetical protein